MYTMHAFDIVARDLEKLMCDEEDMGSSIIEHVVDSGVYTNRCGYQIMTMVSQNNVEISN